MDTVEAALQRCGGDVEGEVGGQWGQSWDTL